MSRRKTIGVYCDRNRNGWHDNRGEWFICNFFHPRLSLDPLDSTPGWVIYSHNSNRREYPNTPLKHGMRVGSHYVKYRGTITDLSRPILELRTFLDAQKEYYGEHYGAGVDMSPPPRQLVEALVPHQFSNVASMFETQAGSSVLRFFWGLEPWGTDVRVVQSYADPVDSPAPVYSARTENLEVLLRCKCGRKFRPLPAPFLVHAMNSVLDAGIEKVSIDEIERLFGLL